jgi:hypothetical protein
MDTNKLRFLSSLVEKLESEGNIVEANTVHNLFIKEAADFDKEYKVKFPMNLSQALDEFDADSYEVDKDGHWEDTETISDFREETSDDMMHSPATVDDDHLVFYNEDKNHVEVMNMIPKHHLETLHHNPSKKTRFIKRADD